MSRLDESTRQSPGPRYIIGSVDHLMALISTALMAIRLENGGPVNLGNVTDKGTWAEEAMRSLEAAREWDRQSQFQHWPKKCDCGQVYTRTTWVGLRSKGFVGGYKSGGKMYAVELRDCLKCDSTIGIEVMVPSPNAVAVDDPRSVSEVVTYLEKTAADGECHCPLSKHPDDLAKCLCGGGR